MSSSSFLGNKREEEDEDDEAINDLELVLLSSIIQYLFVIIRAYADAYKYIHEERVLSRSLPICFVSPTWENLSTRINETVFRKIFLHVSHMLHAALPGSQGCCWSTRIQRENNVHAFQPHLFGRNTSLGNQAVRRATPW